MEKLLFWNLFQRKLSPFFFAPASPRPLAALRIGVAAVLFVQALFIAQDVLEFYGAFGILQGPLKDIVAGQPLLGIGTLWKIFAPLGISADAFVHYFYLAYLVSLFCLLIGIKTRITAIAAWLLHYFLLASGYTSAYGVDQFAHIALFYFLWMPVGEEWSLDAKLAGKPALPSAHARLTLRIFQLHLCVVYMATGIEKALGPQWWNGEAIWRALNLPEFSQVNIWWLSFFPWAAKLLGWATLFLEIAYPLYIFPRKTRIYGVAAILGLHLGIAFTLGLYSFSALMMVFTFCAFGMDAEKI